MLQQWSFSRISTFGHLPHARCRLEPDARFDIAVAGVPFDSATSYRYGKRYTEAIAVHQTNHPRYPGARLGPRAVRNAPARHVPSRGFNTATGNNRTNRGPPCLTAGNKLSPSRVGVRGGELTA